MLAVGILGPVSSSPPSNSTGKTVNLPLWGPRVLILRQSSLKIVCWSTRRRNGIRLRTFAALSAFENGSFPAENGGSDELAISGIGIDNRIVEVLAKKGIVNLFPIQRAVFQPAMEGRDLIARAKTGTGKTLAFGIPILDNISREKSTMQYRPPGTPRAMILAPTRELAKQVETELINAAPHLSIVCIYGGVSIEGQRRQLSSPVDVVVGTPGRVIDMLERGALRLNEVRFAILDEADQMLAVGFAEEVEKIMQKLPIQRQSMLFSATMPSWIRNLTRRYLKDPIMIDLVGEKEDKIAEGIKLYAVATSDPAKNRVLADLLTVYAKGGKAIVFTKTKRDTDDVAAVMSRSIGCEALHGDISQYQREKTLSGFRDGRFNVLVATDVAARGLDIPNVDLIVHYEVPGDSETFVHRSGRTGRAGKTGTCILMYTLPQRRIVRTIELEVGCKFESIGPPASEDVLASSSNHAMESIKNIPPDLAKLFLPAAERLLEEQGAMALAAAMAQVSGVNKLPPKRSLLTHEEGYMTLQLTGDNMVDANAISSAVRGLSSKAGLRMGRVSILASRTAKGGVFDLPEEIAKEVLELEHIGDIVLTALKALPELEEDYSQSYGSFGRGRSFNGGYRSSYGGSSYGGNRSGYGSYGGSSYNSGNTYSRSPAGTAGSGSFRNNGNNGTTYNSGGNYGGSGSAGNSSTYGGRSFSNGGQPSWSAPSTGSSDNRFERSSSLGGNSTSFGGNSNSNSDYGWRSGPPGYGTGSSGYRGTSSAPAPGYGGNSSGPAPGYGGMSSGPAPGYGGRSSGRAPGYGGTSSGPAPGYGGTSSGRAPGYGGTSSGRAPGYGGTSSGPAPGYGGTSSGPAPGYDGISSGPAPGYGGTSSGPAPGYGSGATAGASLSTTDYDGNTRGVNYRSGYGGGSRDSSSGYGGTGGSSSYGTNSPSYGGNQSSYTSGYSGKTSRYGGSRSSTGFGGAYGSNLNDQEIYNSRSSPDNQGANGAQGRDASDGSRDRKSPPEESLEQPGSLW